MILFVLSPLLYQSIVEGLWTGAGEFVEVVQRCIIGVEVSMVTITVTLSEDRLQKLNELAKQFRIAPEELLRVSVEELIARPQADFQKALEYVLEKKKELYKRLE
jgi:hypothetical protein